MKRALLVLFGLVAACGTPTPRPMPLAESGPVEVALRGQAYIADLQPGPVLTVSREAGFANHEGKLAKDVAAEFCQARGGQVSRAAYGQFVAGTWVFRGACA
ncbi:MAG: hypothetical protein ACRC14_03305 [Paracoccaceae bacterium]